MTSRERDNGTGRVKQDEDLRRQYTGGCMERDKEHGRHFKKLCGTRQGVQSKTLNDYFVKNLYFKPFVDIYFHFWKSSYLFIYINHVFSSIYAVLRIFSNFQCTFLFFKFTSQNVFNFSITTLYCQHFFEKIGKNIKKYM